MAAADKEREARRTHLQRAILDLRSRQASELARELLTSDRPKLSADTTLSTSDVKPRPPRRTASARTARDRQTVPRWMQSEWIDDTHTDAYLLQLQNAEDSENVLPLTDAEPPRAASTDSRPYREKFERDGGPRLTVTSQQSKPFTELVRVQRPGLTRQNWQRVRDKLQQNRHDTTTDHQQTSRDAAVNSGCTVPPAGDVPLMIHTNSSNTK